jgi:hypothetical protein
MSEDGYDDGLVHGHRWASEPFGYSPRRHAVNSRHVAFPTRKVAVKPEEMTPHLATHPQTEKSIAR